MLKKSKNLSMPTLMSCFHQSPSEQANWYPWLLRSTFAEMNVTFLTVNKTSVTPSSTTCALTPQTLLRSWTSNFSNSFKFLPGLQFSGSTSDWASVGHVWKITIIQAPLWLSSIRSWVLWVARCGLLGFSTRTLHYNQSFTSFSSSFNVVANWCVSQIGYVFTKIQGQYLAHIEWYDAIQWLEIDMVTFFGPKIQPVWQWNKCLDYLKITKNVISGPTALVLNIQDII